MRHTNGIVQSSRGLEMAAPHVLLGCHSWLGVPGNLALLPHKLRFLDLGLECVVEVEGIETRPPITHCIPHLIDTD